MTKHRKPEEWIEDILAAACEEIEENGYPSLSMNSISKRIALSKGGIYRFFANKKEVALALFTRCYAESLELDDEEIISWNLPVDETFLRLISSFHLPEDSRNNRDRVWIQLLPEIFRDSDFKEKRDTLLGRLLDKYVGIAELLAERDGIDFDDDLRFRVSQGVRMGVALFEGLTIQGALGTKTEERERISTLFVQVIVRDILGRETTEGKGARDAR